MGPINNKPALVQIMAWCQTGNKPVSAPIWCKYCCSTSMSKIWLCLSKSVGISSHKPRDFPQYIFPHWCFTYGACPTSLIISSHPWFDMFIQKILVFSSEAICAPGGIGNIFILLHFTQNFYSVWLEWFREWYIGYFITIILLSLNEMKCWIIGMFCNKCR